MCVCVCMCVCMYVGSYSHSVSSLLCEATFCRHSSAVCGSARCDGALLQLAVCADALLTSAAAQDTLQHPHPLLQEGAFIDYADSYYYNVCLCESGSASVCVCVCVCMCVRECSNMLV